MHEQIQNLNGDENCKIKSNGSVHNKKAVNVLKKAFRKLISKVNTGEERVNKPEDGLIKVT